MGPFYKILFHSKNSNLASGKIEFPAVYSPWIILIPVYIFMEFRLNPLRTSFFRREPLTLLLYAVLPGVFTGALTSDGVHLAGQVPQLSGAFWLVPAFWAAGGLLAGVIRRGFLMRELWTLRFLLLGGTMLMNPALNLIVAPFFFALAILELPDDRWNGFNRSLTAVAFGVSFIVSAWGFGESHVLYLTLLPVMLALEILDCPFGRTVRLAATLVFALLIYFFAGNFLPVRPAAPPENRQTAAALPSSLLPDRPGGNLKFLFLSERLSAIPFAWSQLPYVGSIDVHWPRSKQPLPEKITELNHSGPIHQRHAEMNYDLIFVESLPQDCSPRAVECLFASLAEQLRPRRGVLVVPTRYRKLTPPRFVTSAVLPGNNRYSVFSLDPGLTVAPDRLDRRLQELLQASTDIPGLVPAGIYPALYGNTPVAPPPEILHPRIHRPWSCLWLWAAAAGYLVIRIFLGRYGGARGRFWLTENGVAFALVFLAAWQELERLELLSGLPPAVLCACLGFVAQELKAGTKSWPWGYWLGALLPFLLLTDVFGDWLPYAALLTVLAMTWLTGCATKRVCERSAFTASRGMTFTALGMFAGVVFYYFLGRLCPDPFAAALIAAGFFRIGWLLKL